MTAPVEALFINSGILGQLTFAGFVRTHLEGEHHGVVATQALVTENLSAAERAMRYVLCAQLWPPGLAGLKNLDLHRYRCELNAGLLGRNRLRRQQRAGRPVDVLHFHRQATAYASLGVMRRIPSIVSIDTTQRCVLQQARSPLEKATYAPNIRRDGAVFRAARLIVSTSEWAARSVREEYPDCRTETLVLPNPVIAPPGSERWTGERESRTERPRVLFAGGDFPRKGGFDLLDVWGRGRLHERAALDLMTGWPLDEATLPPGVTVHRGVGAHTERWRQLWHAADLFVLPTRDEAFGMAFQEAAAAGLPAIGPRVNAVPEIVRHGETGLLYPPGDGAALAKAIETLIDTPALRREMGRRARAFMLQAADPERYCRELAAAIRRVAGR